MSDFLEKMSEVLKEEEGQASSSGIAKYSDTRDTKNMRTKGASDYGTYYDVYGHLTTGHGHLVAKAEEVEAKGVAKVLEEFKKERGYSADKMTAKQATTLLKEDIKVRQKDIIKAIPKFESFNDEARVAMASSWFRGSLSGSKKTIGLINEGKFEEASKEFLDNAEYQGLLKNSPTSGIVGRMERTSNALSDLGQEEKPSNVDPAKTAKLAEVIKKKSQVQALANVIKAQRAKTQIQEADQAEKEKPKQKAAKLEQGLFQDEAGISFYVDDKNRMFQLGKDNKPEKLIDPSEFDLSGFDEEN